MGAAERFVRDLDERISNSRLSVKELLSLGRRSPRDVLASGKAATAFGCLDRAATIAAVLADKGYAVNLLSGRISRRGRPIGLHFMIKAEGPGGKFVVDPHSLKTSFLAGWGSVPSAFEMEEPVGGVNRVAFEIVKSVPVPPGSMEKRAFDIAGINGVAGYASLSKLHLPTFVAFLYSRLRPKAQKRAERRPRRFDRG